MRSLLRGLALLAAVASLGVPLASQALVISGASSAFDATIDVSVSGPIVNASLSQGPFSSVSGSAPPPYDLSDALIPFNFSIDGLTVSGAKLFAEASSDVDGSSGAKTTDASGGLETVSITFVKNSITLFDLDITILTASASVTGDYGSLVASGSADILDANLYVWGYSPWYYGYGSPAPNTVLVDNGVVRIVLNEQVVDCSGPVAGVDTCSISVNAVHLEVDGTILLHDVVKDLIIGHAQATMTAVIPEPGVALLLGAGLLLLVTRRHSA